MKKEKIVFITEDMGQIEMAVRAFLSDANKKVVSMTHSTCWRHGDPIMVTVMIRYTMESE